MRLMIKGARLLEGGGGGGLKVTGLRVGEESKGRGGRVREREREGEENEGADLGNEAALPRHQHRRCAVVAAAARYHHHHRRCVFVRTAGQHGSRDFFFLSLSPPLHPHPPS